jgi:hypothetical protein
MARRHKKPKNEKYLKVSTVRTIIIDKSASGNVRDVAIIGVDVFHAEVHKDKA